MMSVAIHERTMRFESGSTPIELIQRCAMRDVHHIGLAKWPVLI